MINYGLHAGQDIFNKQREKYMPSLFNYFSTIKEYFAVNNSYVKQKILVVLYPIKNQKWVRLPSSEDENFNNQDASNANRKVSLHIFINVQYLIIICSVPTP